MSGINPMNYDPRPRSISKKLDDYEKEGKDRIRNHALRWGIYTVEEKDTVGKIEKFLYSDLLKKMELSQAELKKVKDEIRNYIKRENKLDPSLTIKRGQKLHVPTEDYISDFVKNLRRQ